jgi:Protein of unknown function (DUF2798)
MNSLRIRNRFHTLIGPALCAHIATGDLGETMEATARFILAALMSAVMVMMVTLLVTWLNLGFSADFLGQWVKAYFIAWPIAATTGFLVMPMARRATDGIMRLIG